MSDPPAPNRAVSVGAPDLPSPNTLVIGGATVIIPLEMNPEEDPMHDDEVRLWSVRGSFDQTVLASDAAAEPDKDNRLMHYRFENVPYGVYRSAVCVAGQWHDLVTRLVVAPDGVYLGGKKLATDKPAVKAADPDAVGDPGEDDPPPNDPEPVVFMSHARAPEDDDG